MTVKNNIHSIRTGEKRSTTRAPAVKLDEKLKNELLSQVLEEGIVIVHCTHTSVSYGAIRIWNTTVLVDRQSGSRSRLLHALNISIAPVWTEVFPGSAVRFTLIFAPLPRGCESFDLFEDIPQAGGFFVENIQRNRNDVYRLDIV